MESRSWGKRAVYNGSRLLARLAAVAWFRFRCAGREHIPAAGGALICANHQSFLDPMLIGLSSNRRLNYLARETLFHSRTLAWLIDLYDGIPIQRDGLGLSGLKETLRRLRRGEMVLVFPEGTRSWDGQLGPLKPGICAIARRSQVPLVPVAVAGAFEAWPRSQRLPGRAAVWVQFGPPILPVEAAQLSDEALLAELADRLQGCFTRAEAARQP